MSEKRVIHPKLKRQLDVQSQIGAMNRRTTANDNTSHFYVNVYTALEGGVPADHQRNGRFMIGNNRHIFCPDVQDIRPTGEGYTEVKAVSTRTSHPHCSANQLENNSYKFLERINAGDRVPWMDYAFFRYGKDSTRHLYRLTSREHIDTLSDITRDLLIAPLNLTFFLLMNSPSETRNQTSTQSRMDERVYWNVPSSMLNHFHDKSPEQAIDDILEKGTLEGLTREDLFLDQLEKHEYDSPKLYTSWNKGIKSFPVTKYRLPYRAYQKWLQHFNENHEHILESVGARNLYAEEAAFQAAGETRAESSDPPPF